MCMNRYDVLLLLLLLVLSGNQELKFLVFDVPSAADPSVRTVLGSAAIPLQELFELHEHQSGEGRIGHRQYYQRMQRNSASNSCTFVGNAIIFGTPLTSNTLMP